MCVKFFIIMLGLSLCCADIFASNKNDPAILNWENQIRQNYAEENSINNSGFAAIDLDRTRSIRNRGADSRRELLNELIVFLTNKCRWIQTQYASALDRAVGSVDWLTPEVCEEYKKNLNYLKQSKVKDVVTKFSSLTPIDISDFFSEGNHWITRELNIAKALANDIKKLLASKDPEDILFRTPIVSMLDSVKNCYGVLDNIKNFNTKSERMTDDMRSLFTSYLCAYRGSERPLMMSNDDGLIDAIAYMQECCVVVVAKEDYKNTKTNVAWKSGEFLHRSASDFAKDVIYVSFSQDKNDGYYVRLVPRNP